MSEHKAFGTDCPQARCQIADSRFYAWNYTTGEARQIFCDLYRFQRWLEIESCLALTQAELGLIPRWAAEEISRKAHLKNLDIHFIQEGLEQTSHSLVPLLRALEKICENGAGEFIHYGATTQDIQDTGQVLEIKETIQILERDMREILLLLVGLAERYRDTVMIGRTHTQHALPMTLGLKLAVWVDELYRNLDRLQDCKRRLLVAQLFGGVGTMDVWGEKGIELLSLFASRLGLEAPLVAWHVCRDRFAEFLSILSIIAGTLGKIADEIRSLSRSEVGEFEEPYHTGKLGSSTMPHKRNPEFCEQVVVLARLVKAQAMLGFEGLIQEHERDSRALRLEWVTITDACLYTCGALHLVKTILKGLIIHEDRIASNLKNASERITTEALMFALGKKIGKQTAYGIIHALSQQAHEEKRPLKEIVTSHPVIKKELNQSEIEDALEPSKHTGLSRPLTDRVLKQLKDKLSLPAEGERVCPLMRRDEHGCTNGCTILSNEKEEV